MGTRGRPAGSSANTRRFLSLYLDPLWAAEAICRELGISRATFFRYQNELKLPYLRVGISHNSPANLPDPAKEYDLQIARYLASQLCARVKLFPMDSLSPLKALRNGHIDFAVSGLTDNSKRRKDLYFSHAYILNRTPSGLVVGARNNPFYLESGNCKKKILGLTRSSTHEHFAEKKFKGLIRFKKYSFHEVMVQALVGQRIDFILSHEIHVNGLLETHKELEVKAGPFFYGDNTAIAFAPEAELWRPAVNEALEIFHDRGAMTELFRRCFGKS